MDILWFEFGRLIKYFSRAENLISQYISLKNLNKKAGRGFKKQFFIGHMAESLYLY